MIDADVFDLLDDEITRADSRYGSFASTHEGLGVLIEEFDELKAAIHENDMEQVRMESIQVAAVAIRIAESLMDTDTIKRSTPND